MKQSQSYSLSSSSSRSKQPLHTRTRESTNGFQIVSPPTTESKKSAKRPDLQAVAQSHLSLSSPSTASGLAQRPPLPVPMPQRGLEVFVGNDFECCLFDEPIAGMHTVPTWAQASQSAAQSIACFETSVRASQLDVNPTEEQRTQPQQRIRHNLSPDPWVADPGSVSPKLVTSQSFQLTQKPFTLKSAPATSQSDQTLNIRHGSKVVYGHTNSFKKCAVRVLFVNHAMIRALHARVFRRPSVLTSDRSPVKNSHLAFAQDTSLSAAEDGVCKLLCAPDGASTRPVGDANEKANADEDEALPADFIFCLQTELERTFRLDTAVEPMEVPGLFDTQVGETTVCLRSTGSANPAKGAEESFATESSFGPAHHEARPSLSIATTGSEDSGNAVEAPRPKAPAAPPAVKAFAMPVMGVSVFPLQGYGAVGTESSTTIPGMPRSGQKQQSSPRSVRFADQLQNSQQSSQQQQQQQQCSLTMTSSPSNTATLLPRNTLTRTVHREEKRSVTTRRAENSQVDLMNVSHLDHVGAPSVGAASYSAIQQTLPGPLFAVAIAMPFVRQGSVQSIFFDWVRARRPSLIQREIVVRNIIYAVLQRLAALHRRGAVHGSVKATNVFLSAHVLEALDAFSSHRTDPTKSAIRASLGSTGSKLNLIPGTGSRQTSVPPRGVPSFGMSATKPSTFIGIDESEGESSFSASHTSHGNVTDMMEWANHVVLSDGYYAQVEAAMLAALSRSKTCSGEENASTNEMIASSSTRVGLQPLLSLDSLARSCISASPSAAASCTALEELILFTPEELSYVPPPECITPESPSDAPDGKATLLPFRATNNTHCPRALLTQSYDVWMVGMLAIHLADGGFPTWMKRHHNPLPRLRPGSWSVRFASFVQRCASADPAQRPTVDELLRDKWFHTVLVDDAAPRRSPMSAQSLTPSPQQQQQQQQQQPHISRMPCRRAFIDLLMEYHEYAEEWASRVARSTPEAAHPHPHSHLQAPTPKKALLGASGSDMEPPSIARTLRRGPDIASPDAAPVSSERPIRQRGGSNISSGGRSDSSNGGSSRSRSVSTESGSLARQTDAIAFDESGAGAGALPPSFLGAFSVALETCLSEIAAEDTDLTDGDNNNDEEQRQQHQQDLAGQLLQAFWNMHRECRLSADMWCLALMRHMANDGRTAQLIAPILTDETQHCLVAQVEPSEAAAGNSKGPGGKWVSTASLGSASAGGVGQTSQMLSHHQEQHQQVQESQKQVADVSPTAFHNYMFCKWCVTTSWALQQQQQEQQQQQLQFQQDRYTNERKRR